MVSCRPEKTNIKIITDRKKKQANSEGGLILLEFKTNCKAIVPTWCRAGNR